MMISAFPLILPPSIPVKTIVCISISSAISTAFITLSEFPLVVIPIKTSPFCPKAEICREKTELKSVSLLQAVKNDESVVREMDGIAGLL